MSALASVRRRLHRELGPQALADKLLLRNHKLTVTERGEMIVRKLLMTQIAIPVGSAIYWLLSQVHYLWQYTQASGATASLINVNLKKPWDNFPYYFDNMISHPLFSPLVRNAATAAAPAWWVADRHNYRHVLIGFLAYLFVGAFAVAAIKVKKRASTGYMLFSFPAAFAVAIGVSTGLLFLLNKYVAALGTKGVGSGVPFVSDLTGTGAWEPTLIGVLAGLFAHLILLRTFATFQQVSIERNMAQGDKVPTGLRRYLYGSAYTNRWQLMIDRRHVPPRSRNGRIKGAWIGPALTFTALAVFVLLGVGLWLNYFGGPATLAR